MPGAQEVRAEPVVETDARVATSITSAPTSSQTFAISLMKLMRVVRKALAASLIISAEATSVVTIVVSMPS